MRTEFVVLSLFKLPGSIPIELSNYLRNRNRSCQKCPSLLKDSEFTITFDVIPKTKCYLKKILCIWTEFVVLSLFFSKYVLNDYVFCSEVLNGPGFSLYSNIRKRF